MTFSELFTKWGLQNIKLNVGFAEVEICPTEADQSAAWDMYVELLTRATTQPLIEDTGDEETALTSIYHMFAITRDILKEKGIQAQEFTKIAVIVLNQIIRPFTTKWHKKKLEGAFNITDECLAFRNELSVLQNHLKCYSHLLADLAKVEDLTNIA